MKRIIAALALVASLAACDHTISPAEGTLYGCDAFASALDVLTPMRAAGKLSDATVDVVTKTRDAVQPVCTGAAPDINSSVKSVLVDSGTKVLVAIAASVLGSN